MRGSDRLVQLGFDPKIGGFKNKRSHLVYYFYFSATVAYNEDTDKFRLLQDTGKGGGRGVVNIKADALKRNWEQLTY